ncbi:Tetratricopeptide repeat-containing protein [Humidesulfovibrio mexicanus]|uniref:Tetratricopeptide repeat-containing protein n=1 Tax=Humidesulfovibrio mexicanus TaxID=147047 RepID=A0A239BSU4_9BACT|nr:tetratricopeptide repeat protein [Humidesulfovibrio mexicanus]SNS10478.1 Tetratricopeptide repeat-containing protein [Humidesulfovibrio mexicanus]
MRARVSAVFAAIVPVLLFVATAAAFVAAPVPAWAGSPYVEGLDLYRQGRYAEAAKVLRAALPEQSPVGETNAPESLAPSASFESQGGESAHARAVLGFALLRMNLLPEAEEQFGRIRADAALGSVGALGAGWALYARGETTSAVDALNEALDKSRTAPAYPDMLRESVPADARLALGLIALGRGQPREARAFLEAAAPGPDVLGSPKELLLALGDARAQLSDRAGALAAWAEVQRSSSTFPGDAPRDDLARLKAARLHESAGEAEAALALYAGLTGGRHYRSEALLGQARTLLAQGRREEARAPLRGLVCADPNMAAPLERAVMADPVLRPVLKDWGLAFFHKAEYMAALEKLSAYLDDVDPGDEACLLGMGWSFLRLGHLDRAWESFSDAASPRHGAGKAVGGGTGAQVGLAATALARGRADQARELLGRVLAAEPRNALALNTLGHLELAQGDSQKALDAFRAALSARPDYVDSRLAAARILYDRAQFDAAAAEYFRLVTQEKRSTTGWNGLGWARLRLGQYDDALSAFAEARRQNPTLPAAAYGMGITLARQGRAEQASKRLAEAIFLSPDFAATPEVLELMRSRPEYLDLFLEMGEAYARKLYPTTAAPYLEEYLRQNPNSRPGRRALAWASFWAGQEDKAHALFQTLITVNKDDADAHLGDGLSLLSRGHLDMAEPHLRDAVRLDPTNSLNWRALVLLLTRQGRDREAVAAQQQAPKSRHERLDRMSASGFAALNEGRVADAVRDFRRAVALDKGLAGPRYGLAFALVAQGEHEQAREELLAGLNLDPAFLDEQELSDLLSRHAELGALAMDLSWSQLYALNLPAARSGFERILAGGPGGLEALFGLGATAYLQGDWALAENCFDRLLPRAPLTGASWDKWSHLMDKLGWSAYHQHQYDKALQSFDWLRTYHPETPYAAALGGMGWALLAKGQNQEAQTLFLRSLGIFPRNLTAMQGMIALKKAPETDEEDMDDEPEPQIAPKRKGKKAKAALRGADGDDEPKVSKKKGASAKKTKSVKKAKASGKSSEKKKTGSKASAKKTGKKASAKK